MKNSTLTSGSDLSAKNINNIQKDGQDNADEETSEQVKSETSPHTPHGAIRKQSSMISRVRRVVDGSTVDHSGHTRTKSVSSSDGIVNDLSDAIGRESLTMQRISGKFEKVSGNENQASTSNDVLIQDISHATSLPSTSTSNSLLATANSTDISLDGSSVERFLGVVDIHDHDQSEHCLLFKLSVPYENTYKLVEFIFDLNEDEPQHIVEEIYGLEELAFLAKYANEIVASITPVVNIARRIDKNMLKSTSSLSRLVLQEISTIPEEKVPHSLLGLFHTAEDRLRDGTSSPLVDNMRNITSPNQTPTSPPEITLPANSSVPVNTNPTSNKHGRSISMPLFPSSLTMSEAANLAHERAHSDTLFSAQHNISLIMDSVEEDEELRQLHIKYTESVTK